jgi:hypothetical protein
MSKRIERDINELKKNYDNIIINDREIIIDNKIIIISKNYPFEMPKLYIKNIEYYNYLYINNIKINNILNKNLNIKCLCCSSILCNTNWHPKYSLMDILKEIESVNNIKLQIKNIIYLEILSKKYNIINIVFNDIKKFLI